MEELDACLKPACRNERLNQARKDKETAEAKRQGEDILRYVNKCDSLGYAAALGSLPQTLLVFLAAPLLLDNVEWHKPEIVKQFAKDIGWTGELENYVFRNKSREFRRSLEAMPGRALAGLLLDLMIAHGVRYSDTINGVRYLVGEPIPEPESKPEDDEDDEGVECPDDCDGDCANCDVADRQLAQDPEDDEPEESEEEAGADPVSPPAVESPAEYPAEPAPPEDPNWTAVVRAAFATVGAPIEACTRETKLEDLSEYWDDFMSSSFGIALENRFDIQVPDNVSKAWVTLGDAADFVMEQLAQEQE